MEHAPRSGPALLADMDVAATLLNHATQRADKVAIVCGERRRTYGWLAEATARLARRLARAGVEPGDRVAYLGRESEYYYSVMLACARMGGVLVPVNWRLTTAEISHILNDSGANTVIADREFAGHLEPLITDRPVTVIHTDSIEGVAGAELEAWWSDEGAEPIDPPGPAADRPLVQIYTSGTTGLPKGVVLGHRSFFTLPAAMQREGQDWIDWLESDVNLIALPGLGIAGIGWFLHGLIAGGTNVVMRLFDAQEAVRLIAQESVTTMFAAPAMLQMMLDEANGDPTGFASLRKVAYGAAPISQSLLHRCLTVFGCDLAQIYASTEAGSVAVCLPPRAHRDRVDKLRSAGLPCPGNDVRVCDEGGSPVGSQQIGHVWIKSPAVMLGYWNRPEDTASTLVDGWLRMGDAGYLDDDGYLHLCDRVGDTIIVAGQNIYPAEVELALEEHPRVASAAVVGLPDEHWGEAVHAAVVLDDGVRPTARELLDFVRGRLADYKLPTQVHVVASLPRNPSGKVLRRTVREDLTVREKEAVS